MTTIRRTRTIVVATLAIGLICLGGGALAYLYATEDRPYPMKDYTSNRQRQAANLIVQGLNTRDPDEVDLFRIDGQPESAAYFAAITKNVSAVLPLPGCRYSLLGTTDQGAQDPGAVPWYHPSQARGFDMSLQQTCPEQQPTHLTIRVIAIPSGMGGYWAEAALQRV